MPKTNTAEVLLHQDLKQPHGNPISWGHFWLLVYFWGTIFIGLGTYMFIHYRSIWHG